MRERESEESEIEGERKHAPSILWVWQRDPEPEGARKLTPSAPAETFF